MRFVHDSNNGGGPQAKLMKQGSTTDLGIKKMTSKTSMPHINVHHKSLDLYFEVLDSESRKQLYEDLKAGRRIKAPNFGDRFTNTVKEFVWNDLDLVDKLQIKKLLTLTSPSYPQLKYNPETRSFQKIHTMKQVHSVVKAFLKLSGYDREKIKPGYKGQFVIHSHFAEKAGHHFDLRLEFPVTSLYKALGTYEGKRLPETREPMEKYPDKPGTVYRSFAVKKHTLPTAETKLFIVETEDHPIQYGLFKGEIKEGYGKGKVDIFDKGTFEILDVDGDKKYTIDFKGNKLKGTYAFVKYHHGYLWVKTKDQERKASTIDYVQPTLDPVFWDLATTPPKLLASIRDSILRTFTDTCMQVGLIQPFRWVKGMFISGSSTTYNYKDDGDLDIDILYDSDKFSLCYPGYKNDTRMRGPEETIFAFLKRVIYTANSKPVGNTKHTYSFMVLQDGDVPSGDALYDLLKNDWAKLPVKIPFNFDPDRAFLKERMFAQKIARDIDILNGRIIRLADNILKLNQYSEKYGLYEHRKFVLTASLRSLCTRLDNYHELINKMTETAKTTDQPLYSAYPIGPNWDSRQIIFKYLARSGYHRPVHMLYVQLNSDEKKLIDQFIPN